MTADGRKNCSDPIRIEPYTKDRIPDVLAFERALRRLGVIDELRAQGAGEGSTVRIDDMEFDFVD